MMDDVTARASLGVEPHVLDTASADVAAAAARIQAGGSIPAQAPQPTLARSAAGSSRANSRLARKPPARRLRRPNPSPLLPRRQVHLIRALAGNSPQERVDFSLHVDDLLSLGQALFQVNVPLAQLRDLDCLRIGSAAAF